MEAVREGKIKDVVRQLAAEFLQREGNGTSLITVTGVEVSGDGKLATVLFTVLPENKQEAALDFATRRLGDFREYVKEKSRMQRIPFFTFKIDAGEKNRQRIDDISNLG